ncbi:MAG: right-handed parallel beta-helix repeat-containing protein [Phycisphaerae bacterium]|nr:right-handed parallel beta-helix repeat-containing protein [Phycisphaerae bacterium]
MSDIDRRALIAGASLIGAMALARSAKAGQLSPPAGPVGATGRSLRDVEPRTPISTLSGSPEAVAVISESGAYVLTGELHVPAGMSGIVVTASGPVSIDLRGFAITGSAGSLKGIACVNGQCSYLEVYDGFIRDCDGDGLDGGPAETLEVDDVHVSHCGTGIRKALGRMKCTDVTLERAAGHGLVYAPSGANPGAITALECVIDDCEFSECGGSGVRLEGDYSGIDCSIWVSDCDCHRNGLDGIGGNFGSTPGLNGNDLVTLTIDECNCAGNGRFGIGVQAPISPLGTSVGVLLECSDCTCADNASDGLRVQAVRATIQTGDFARNGGDGMNLQDVSGAVECCLCAHNAANGMRCVNVQSAIDEVDCRGNGADGLFLTNVQGAIDECECSQNTLTGIRLSGGTRGSVCHCACAENGADGFLIEASCSGLAITECDARGNAAGFRVDGPNNLLLWNTASLNVQNFQAGPGTPLVVLSPGDLPANTNPHANYSL